MQGDLSSYVCHDEWYDSDQHDLRISHSNCCSIIPHTSLTTCIFNLINVTRSFLPHSTIFTRHLSSVDGGDDDGVGKDDRVDSFDDEQGPDQINRAIEHKLLLFCRHYGWSRPLIN